MKSGITPKQQLFVDEYLIDSNATQAATRAGYSKKMASRIGFQLLEKTRIAAAIRDAIAARAERTHVDQDWVISRLVLINDRCLEIAPVVDRSGKITEGQFTFDSAGANRSAELLGKHLKMFTDKVEQSGPNGGAVQVQHVVDLSKLTLEQLRALRSLAHSATVKPATD